MLVSFIGVLLILVVAIVVGARWFEKSLWLGALDSWRHAVWGTTSQEKEKILRKEFEALETESKAKHEAFLSLFHRVHDCDGLEAQVADLKQVLEWTRTSLNDAKQECLEQMGWAHEARERFEVSEDVRRDQNKELRQRATAIRKLTVYLEGRDVVIENLRRLLLAKPRAKRTPAKKKKIGLESRRFTVIGRP